MTLSSQVFKTSKAGGFTDVLGSLFQCWNCFPYADFFLMSSRSVPGQNWWSWWSFVCSVSSATPKNSLTRDRSVGYMCTTAVKKICSFSDCETEQKVITIYTHTADLVLYPETLSSMSAPSRCTLLLGVKGRTCWQYHAEELSKKRSDWLNIHLCKYFPCQFRQMLLTVHSIMLSTH